MIDIEKLYADSIFRDIVKREAEIKAILESAIKELSKRIANQHINYPDIMKEGMLFRSNKSVERQISKTLERLYKEIDTAIQRDVKYGWNLANQKNGELVAMYTQGIKISQKIIISFNNLNLEALNEFLKRTEAGLDISKRVWNLTEAAKSQLELYLGSGISSGKSAAGISRDIRNYLNEPKKLFRRVRVDGKLVLSKSAKAYHPGSGVYRSSYKNALRLAANETNLAYRLSDFTRRQQMPFVTGIEVHLSASHEIMDLCDDMVGRYPKGYIFSGFHANCFCYSTSILLNKKEFIDHINGGKIRPQRYVRTIPKTAENWIEKNKGKIAGYKTKPYFIRDNFTNDFKVKQSILKVKI